MRIDPEILLGLQNYKQNQSSLELQREILAMQKLQVLNQIRISEGLPPLAKLPQPQMPQPKAPIIIRKKERAKIENLIVFIVVFLLFTAVCLFFKSHS
jgi:hypothetical protein